MTIELSIPVFKISLLYAYLNAYTDGAFCILLGTAFQILPPAYLNDFRYIKRADSVCIITPPTVNEDSTQVKYVWVNT